MWGSLLNNFYNWFAPKQISQPNINLSPSNTQIAQSAPVQLSQPSNANYNTGQLNTYSRPTYQAPKPTTTTNPNPTPGVLGAGTNNNGSSGNSGSVSPGGGASTSSSNGSGGTDPNYDNYMQILKANFDNARSGLTSQDTALDSSYNLSKGDIQSSIDDADKTAQQQESDNEITYGKLLKQQAQTYRDLRNGTRNQFSVNNALDSNAFDNADNKLTQDMFDQTSETGRQKQLSTDSIHQTLTKFTNNAKSQLGQLAIQYQQGKDAIQQALSQNNINEAGAIQQALDQIQARAQTIKQNMMDWSTKAALLKSQGIDVLGALRGITGDGYASNVTSQLNSANQWGSSLIPALLQNPGMIKTDKKDIYGNPIP